MEGNELALAPSQAVLRAKRLCVGFQAIRIPALRVFLDGKESWEKLPQEGDRFCRRRWWKLFALLQLNY